MNFIKEIFYFFEWLEDHELVFGAIVLCFILCRSKTGEAGLYTMVPLCPNAVDKEPKHVFLKRTV